MSIRFLFIVFSLQLSFTACKSQINISPFPAFSAEGVHNVQGKQYSFKYVAFLVENYNEDSLTVDRLDAFVRQQKFSDTALFYSYHISFYKKTDNTNFSRTARYKKGVPAESLNDLVFSYVWQEGHFSGKHRFRDGELITAQEIKVEPIRQ